MKKFMHIIITCSLVFLTSCWLTSCGNEDNGSSLSSLTDSDYTGQKYYFGFGENESRPNMANEIKYDILHTHGIFTKNIGGDYIGKTLIHDEAFGSSVKAGWAEIKKKMKEGDMYVQYSSGHGYQGGLALGVKHSEIRDNALSLPAKEVIIFTMACYSGTLVDSFNQKKSEWENWPSKGKTLLVMASSQSDELSQTGPGTDADEPNGEEGTAGSAYGHALWKALIGYSDGFIDGVKDDFITLGEIVEYTKWKTIRVGGHTPSITGAYNPNLIMNRVPPKAYIESLVGGTQGMSDDEVRKEVNDFEEEYLEHLKSE